MRGSALEVPDIVSIETNIETSAGNPAIIVRFSTGAAVKVTREGEGEGVIWRKWCTPGGSSRQQAQAGDETIDRAALELVARWIACDDETDVQREFGGEADVIIRG